MTELTEEEIEKILSIVESKLGQEGRAIVSLMIQADHLLTVEEMEELLEDDPLPMDKKQVRQILYELNDLGFARSRRLRDKETGWIHFYWNLFPDKILEYQ